MAITNKSYNNVIYFLCRLGEYHEQIETVSVGDIFEIDMSKDTLFPLMHINPVNVTTGESELIYNFQIFLADLVSEKDNWQSFSPGRSADGSVRPESAAEVCGQE